MKQVQQRHKVITLDGKISREFKYFKRAETFAGKQGWNCVLQTYYA